MVQLLILIEQSFEQDNEYSMWSRPFTLGSQQVRVQEEWGLGIGESSYTAIVRLGSYDLLQKYY